MAIQVLVLEDDPDVALMVGAMLERFGHRYLGAARNADEALRIAKAIPVDLALVEVHLRSARPPEEGGLRAAEGLWRHCRVPTLFMTGAGYKLQPGRHGCGVLRKPFTPALLDLAVRSAVASTRDANFVAAKLDGLRFWPNGQAT